MAGRDAPRQRQRKVFKGQRERKKLRAVESDNAAARPSLWKKASPPRCPSGDYLQGGKKILEDSKKMRVLRMVLGAAAVG